jgi:signal peptidase I
MAGPMDDIKRFFSAHPDLYQFMKDLAFSLAFVAVIALALYLYAGTWSPVVSVDGTSMLDHMHAGDLVLVQGLDRGAVKTYEESVNTSYVQYGEPGDVIVYYPYGRTDLPMVIHRAIRWVNESEPMWPGGLPAPASGYITLGDNNRNITDQESNICYLQPVRPEWVHGIARIKVPYLGYLRSLLSGVLHI